MIHICSHCGRKFTCSAVCGRVVESEEVECRCYPCDQIHHDDSYGRRCKTVFVGVTQSEPMRRFTGKRIGERCQ